MDEHKNEEYVEEEIVIVTDETDNSEHTFVVLDRIETEEHDRYMALTATYGEEEDLVEEDGELIILKVIDENGDDYLIPIEDDTEMLEIYNLFEQRLSELYDDTYFDDDEDEEDDDE